MKTAFHLINLVVGIGCVWVGFGNLENLPNSLGSAIAGALAIAAGGICLWLSAESTDSAQVSPV
ncbi:MAG: hypothetical protein AUJ20_02835 [Comamonadaceae bacterium CG1_02_60_18]|nr:MAG: hypothetical protein AUJ20_02835 [Comamonadaceae bacterium CG1_02_60_18]PIQ56576.1 MAG: hypothetical protein COW02_00465 [Comamonadaceae bacterium CG12_big_fil_rev_8_21_14_0_65_59_15]